MIAIDTGGSGGSQGPWLIWSSNGSAEKGFPPRSWVLRERDETGNTVETVIPAFEAGCILDLDSLKLGWERGGGIGQAPERRWNPSVAQSTPRPDESKKTAGVGFAWQQALSVRVAIGQGRAATWEQGAFGAYEAFSRLARQIIAQHPGDGTLPLVKQTGVEKLVLTVGSANVPLLEVAKWVPAPQCLKAAEFTIETGEPAAPPPPPPPAATVSPIRQRQAPAQAAQAAQTLPIDIDEF